MDEVDKRNFCHRMIPGLRELLARMNRWERRWFWYEADRVGESSRRLGRLVAYRARKFQDDLVLSVFGSSHRDDPGPRV